MNTARLASLILAGASLTLFAAPGIAQTNTDTNAPTRLSETTVTATNELKEDMLMGDNQQPAWTARRRFVTTRVYVQPPWQMEAEIGLNSQIPRAGYTDHFLTEEFELGLPHRFQVDFENRDHLQNGHWDHDSVAFELRYALADWDVLPGNPTLGSEWRINDIDADEFELTLQLGGDICPRWHWGANAFYGQQVGSNREREFSGTAAVSYALIDERFGVGAEAKFSSVSDNGNRNNPEDTFEAGPSFQWRPCKRVHLDVVPLFGMSGHSLRTDLFIFMGFDFGRGSRENDAVSPASMRAK